MIRINNFIRIKKANVQIKKLLVVEGGGVRNLVPGSLWIRIKRYEVFQCFW